jgi:uncharacterized protein (TIGR01777 family)
MKKAVVAGGTGFIGAAVVREFLASGHQVVVLSRKSATVPGATVSQWDGKTLGTWTADLEGAAALVNLTGAPILARWTEGHKQAMRASRVGVTTLLGEAVAKCAVPPQCWINASAIGYYGDTGSRKTAESARPGRGVLAEMCVEWENAALQAPTPSTRKAPVRIGYVLGRGGPGFEALARATKLMLGGPLGNGRQYMAWIHLEDLARMIVWAVSSDIRGPMNGTAPNPVTNAEMMAAFRRVYGRPPAPPVPGFALKAMSAAMGWPEDMITASSRVVPEVALAHGFVFKYPTIESALAELTDDTPAAWRGVA